MKSRFAVASLGCLLLSALAGGANAPDVTGTVYDPAAGTVAGARVMLMRDYVKLRETKSDEAGRFAFGSVEPGTYELQIKQQRFSLWQQTIVVTAGRNVSIYAVLPLARMMDIFGVTTQLAAGVEKHRPAKAARAGGNVEPAGLLTPARPAYPPEASADGAEGDVVLWTTIRMDGALGEPVVIASPHPALERAAIESAKQLRYAPMKLNGQAVDCQHLLIINYRLQ